MTITFLMDGQEITSEEGKTLLEVAQEHGTYIPTICFHEATTANGLCRICVVEVEGMRILQPACIVQAANNLKVQTRSEKVVRARRTLSDLLDRQRPDVAITHSCWTHGLAAPVVAKHGISAVPWIHDRLSGRTWVERWASRSTPPAVICNSRYTADSVASVFPSVRTHVVYAPVAGGSALTVGDRQQLRRFHEAADETCVVLIASRFEAWKGHHDLIESLASLSAPWQLWIAGEVQKPGERAYDRALR